MSDRFDKKKTETTAIASESSLWSSTSMLICTIPRMVLMWEQLNCVYAWHFNQNWFVLSNVKKLCINATGWNLVCSRLGVIYSKFIIFFLKRRDNAQTSLTNFNSRQTVVVVWLKFSLERHRHLFTRTTNYTFFWLFDVFGHLHNAKSQFHMHTVNEFVTTANN